MRLQKGISRQVAPALGEIETERDAERDKERNRDRNRLGPPRSCWHTSEDAQGQSGAVTLIGFEEQFSN